MNLKLSTAAALAINAISKTGGADSKAVLTEKVASSYEQHAVVFGIGSAGRQRILQDSRGLQAHIKKDDATGGSAVDSALESSAGNSKTGDGVNNLLNADVGILGLRAAMGRRTLQNSNVQPKKRDTSLLAKMVTKPKDLDVGVLGEAKNKGDQQIRASLVLGRLLQTPSTDNQSGYEGSNSTMFPTSTHLCGEYNILAGTMRPYTSQLHPCQCQGEKSSTCGPDLCNCLENSQGDFLSCMDEVNMLCEGKVSIGSDTVSTLTMEECAATEFFSHLYCTFIPCYVGGGSYAQCICDTTDHICSTSNSSLAALFYCPTSACCKNQTDDEGRLACFGITYGTNITEYYSQREVVYAQYVECRTNSSVAKCACKILAPFYCTNGYCDLQTCCQSYKDDAGLVDCYGNALYSNCTGKGKLKYNCLCEESYFKCYTFNDQQQCDVVKCCVDKVTDGRKACFDLGNSTTASTQEVPNGSNGSIDTPTTTSAPESTTEIPNKPTTNPGGNSAVGTPMANAAAVESVYWMKSMTLSVISLVVVGWFMMV